MDERVPFSMGLPKCRCFYNFMVIKVMQQLRFTKPERKQVDPRIIQYALNPPCSKIPATHYATVAGDTMRYLLLNGDWFVFTFGWQYIQHKPHCTLVGEVEKPREQISKQVASSEYKHKETPIYSDRRYKGD